jgi:hypothetical protein
LRNRSAARVLRQSHFVQSSSQPSTYKRDTDADLPGF